MGVYLSEPAKEKHSTDGTYDKLSYGASSMQGWRVAQEDSHNCIIDYDKDTSFFAVYDGHGGAEVAQYCSQHLPDFIREMPHYKEGDLIKALENGFLEFDLTLKKPQVTSVLREMAGVTDASVSDDENEAAALQEEADMPLEDVLARYQGPERFTNQPYCRHLHDDKPRSPYLRAKKCHANGNEDDLDEPCSSKTDRFVPVTKLNTIAEEDSIKKETDSGTSLNGTGDKSTSDNKDNAVDVNNKVEPLLQEALSSSLTTNYDNLSAKSSESVNPSELSAEKPGSSKQPGEHDSKIAMRGECSSGKLGQNHVLVSRSVKHEKEELSSDEGDSSDEDEFDKDEADEDDDDDSDDEEEEESEEEEEEEDYDEVDEAASYKYLPGQDSGCTAVVAILRGSKLYVANAGDSRCVVSRKGTAIEMSFDHKPEDEPERTRIVKAGGEVTTEGRVNGGLNLSRAIGDHSYKENSDLPQEEQMITALPDIKTLDIDPTKEEFMVLACDGIWNSMTSQEVVDFVQHRIVKSDYSRLSLICEELFEYCLAPNTLGDGSGCDNMTCIIVKFHASPALKRRLSGGEGTTNEPMAKKICQEKEQLVKESMQSNTESDQSSIKPETLIT